MTAALMVAILAVSAASLAEPKPRKEAAPGTVVFVCEHGNVKSLMAGEPMLIILAGLLGIALHAAGE